MRFQVNNRVSKLILFPNYVSKLTITHASYPIFLKFILSEILQLSFNWVSQKAGNLILKSFWRLEEILFMFDSAEGSLLIVKLTSHWSSYVSLIRLYLL